MPDTGAPWNIPYVAGTDLVADWPTDSQALAEAVEDALNASIPGNVVQVTKTDTTSTTSTSFSTLLTATITPISTASRILVMAFVTGTNPNNAALYLRLDRGGTDILLGDTAGSRTRVTGSTYTPNNLVTAATMLYVDSPATTSATTYNVKYASGTAGNAVGINFLSGESDSAGFPRAASTLILMEVNA